MRLYWHNCWYVWVILQTVLVDVIGLFYWFEICFHTCALWGWREVLLRASVQAVMFGTPPSYTMALTSRRVKEMMKYWWASRSNIAGPRFLWVAKANSVSTRSRLACWFWRTLPTRRPRQRSRLCWSLSASNARPSTWNQASTKHFQLRTHWKKSKGSLYGSNCSWSVVWMLIWMPKVRSTRAMCCHCFGLECICLCPTVGAHHFVSFCCWEVRILCHQELMFDQNSASFLIFSEY